jgi:uncharacterized protein YkwD
VVGKLVEEGILHMIAYLLMLVAQVAVSPEPCSVLTPGENQLVEKTNEARITNGLAPLVIDCRLMGSARRHARRLAREMAFYHSTGVAENIATGQPFASDAVVVWLHSPGHRANILGRNYSRIGVAGFVAPNGKTYWVQQFAP